MANLSVGDMAPHFEGKTQDGTTLSLEDLKGGCTVLYFYPKDNTSGCTLEAKSLRRQGGAGSKRLSHRGSKSRQRAFTPELLRKARAELHAAGRHRPYDLRGIWSVGREVYVWTKIYGRGTQNIPTKRRGTYHTHLRQGKDRRPLPSDY